jgi:hypothetical protein
MPFRLDCEHTDPVLACREFPARQACVPALPHGRFGIFVIGLGAFTGKSIASPITLVSTIR